MDTFKTALIIRNTFTGRKRICEFDTFDIAYRVYRKIRRLYKDLYMITFVKCI